MKRGMMTMRACKIRRFAFLFLSAGFLCAAAAQASFPDPIPSSTEVIVEDHQTLWDIAAQHVGDDTDIRRYVYDLQQINHISDPGMLHPGQIIRIPRP